MAEAIEMPLEQQARVGRAQGALFFTGPIFFTGRAPRDDRHGGP